MPTRNLYLHDSDRSLLITPRALINSETNNFDKSFSADIPIEEWQDWMRWDSAAIESDSTLLGRKDSFESTLSMYDAADTETAPFSACSTDTRLSFADAPFEIETDESIDSSKLLTTSKIPMYLRRPVRGHSTFRAAEQQSLQDTVMPHRMLSQVKLSSEPSSPTTTITNSLQSQYPSPEPEIRTRKAKKRKSSMDGDDLSNKSCKSRKRGHNAIEKRYRTNLNDKISCLQQGIPPLCRQSSSDSKSGDEAEDCDQDATDKKTGQQKYSKAAILTRALEYIQHLESTTQRLSGEVAVLTTKVRAFERLTMSGSIVMNSAPVTVTSGFLTPKKETLESIQEDFKQVKHKSGGSRRSSKKVVRK